MTPAEDSLDTRFATAMGQLLGPDFPSDIALAVSGGGDSMAMLTLAHNWTHVWGVRLHVVTVNHNLRPEAADEAALVARTCVELGHSHTVLDWHWDGQGNLMERARDGRLSTIDAWRGDIAHVLVAHTRDDVAETFLMRLSRGSGVSGLSAMQSVRRIQYFHAPDPIRGVRAQVLHLLRPCLDMTRAELRHYLRTLKGDWVEDPTNVDPTYLRARMRAAMPDLAALGLDVDTLSATAHRLARATEALNAHALAVWSAIDRTPPGDTTGDLILDRDGLARTDRDTQLRLLAVALRWVSSTARPPREDALEALLDRLLAGGGGTLHGCDNTATRDTIRIAREPAAVAAPQPADTLWDGRWRAVNPQPNQTIRALGEDGWAQIKDRPDGSPAFRTARALPSLWAEDTLVSCPALGVGTAQIALWPMGREDGGCPPDLLSR